MIAIADRRGESLCRAACCKRQAGRLYSSVLLSNSTLVNVSYSNFK